MLAVVLLILAIALLPTLIYLIAIPLRKPPAERAMRTRFAGVFAGGCFGLIIAFGNNAYLSIEQDWIHSGLVSAMTQVIVAIDGGEGDRLKPIAAELKQNLSRERQRLSTALGNANKALSELLRERKLVDEWDRPIGRGVQAPKPGGP